MNKSVLLTVICSIFLIGLLSSCKYGKTRIQYSFAGCYKLSDDEIYSSISQKDIDYFAECCYMDSVNPMVNRLFTASDHRSYISLITAYTPYDVEMYMKQDSSFKILETSEFGTKKQLIHAFLMTRGDYYVARYLFTEFGRPIVVMYDVVGENKTAINKIFNNEELIKRKLNCGKK